MKVFLDTNIAIDYLSQRGLFSENAYRLFLSCERKGYRMCISALSFTTIFYVLRKQIEHKQLLHLLLELRQILLVLPTDDIIIEKALQSKFSDFEDAVQYYTALHSKVDYIVTRNKKDYSHSDLPVFDPTELMSMI